MRFSRSALSRPALLSVIALAIALSFAVALPGLRGGGPVGDHGSRQMPVPDRTQHAHPPPFQHRGNAGVLDAGPMAEVLPMHQAVRLAARRFHGRPLDITLVAPHPDETAAGVALVYRIRMLTRSRDVLDIRMDALDGRFLELSGADLSQVRRALKDPRKDD